MNTVNMIVHNCFAYSSDSFGLGNNRTSCNRRCPRDIVNINDQRTEF